MSVHLILQGKGGVGKSVTSTMLAQYKLSRGKQPVCIDTDPVNTTFLQFSKLNVRHVQLIIDEKIQPDNFEILMEEIMTNPEKDYVIDNGASSFLPLSAYLIENEIFSVLSSVGHEIYIHTIVTGGPALSDTLTGLDALTQQFPDDVEIIVWLNEYFGKIDVNGSSFTDIDFYQDNKERISGIITFEQQSDMFAKSLDQMLSKRLTFDEIKTSDDFNFFSKNRLDIYSKKLFDQLDNVFATIDEKDN